MLAGVTRYMHEHEPWAIYLKGFGIDKSLSKWLRDWKGDGIIAAITDKDIEFTKEIAIPVVDVVGLPQAAHIPLVHANDEAIGRAGAEHLLERGYNRFGFIEYSDFLWAAKRRTGYEKVIHQAGYQCQVYQLPRRNTGPEIWEQQQARLIDWLKSLPKPAGVMASTDFCGQQFLEACLRADFRVPEEIAVIGADNDELICNISSPPLSSVIINDEQRGYEAAAMLDCLMAGKTPPCNPVYIEPGGIASRASTDILAIDDEPLAAALRFVRDHACDGITVNDIINAIPMSRSVMERKFRKVIGRSVNEEIIRVQLNRAVELLSSTRLELKEIAQRAGFCTPSYMGAVFRQRLSRTPGSYRAAARGSLGELVRDAIPDSK
jgi:LacI family transcriptional regulator